MPSLPLDAQSPIAPRLQGVASSPVREILALTERSNVLSFAGGLPAPELFDGPGIAAAFAEVLHGENAARSLQYSTTEGDPLLRSLVSQRLTDTGLPSEADDLLITTGSQQALTLIATAMLEPGDKILVENPSYLAALQCFALAGAVPIPVPCDEDGIIPSAIPSLVKEHSPKLLYTIPNFQNPTGRTIPASRREELAKVIAEHKLWTVEDDPYGELRYSGERLIPLANHDGARDYVLALSTLSKVAAPGLRIGWVRAPELIRRSLTIAKQAADLHSATVVQVASARWLAQTDLDTHLAQLRGVYRERRDALLELLPGTLPAGSTFNRPEGGMFVWIQLPEGFNATELLPRALAQDVAYVPGAPFFAQNPDERALRLSFVTHEPSRIREGMQRLQKALHEI